MQVISVERWTFWTAVVTAVVAPILTNGFGVWAVTSDGGVTSTALAVPIESLAFVLLLVSVALGTSREPSVRRVKRAVES